MDLQWTYGQQVREKLTKTLIEDQAPEQRPFELRDTEIKGLLLRVQPSGIRTWYFDYRLDGRRNRHKLGLYPNVSVDGARSLAKGIAGDVSRDIDPQERRKADRAEAKRAKASTLDAFIHTRYEPWALTHLKQGRVAVDRLKADFSKWLTEPLESFNAWRVEGWRRDRLRAHIKPVTINRQLDTLRACLRKAVDWKIIGADPLQGLKRLKVDDDERVRFLSTEEEPRFRDALVKRETNLREARNRFNAWRAQRHLKPLPAITSTYVDHVRPLVMIALNTGLRRGELFSLQWGDIDFASKMLTVRAAAAKSADSRRVPLNAEALQVLSGWKAQQGRVAREAFVFPGDDGRRLTRMDKSWETLCKLAKVTNYRFHDCRHHFASRLVQAGVDLNTVRELMGHADIAMTLRYAHLAPDNLRSAVDKLAG